MKLIDEIIIFPLIRTLNFYLISNLLGEVPIRGKRLKEGDAYFLFAYFKVREIYHIKFQKFQKFQQ